jgi:hypothetical protein
VTELAFLCPPELAGHIPYPQPAANRLPDWLPALPLETGLPEKEGFPEYTLRACLPALDAFALGWMLPLPFDIAMTRDPQGQLMFHWADGLPFQPVQLMHPVQLGAETPPFAGHLPLKFINPWRVVLPEGWSAAVLPPLNHFELPFRPFAGVVDCDALPRPVNIPFLWDSDEESRLLPAGTPLAQIVPFERARVPPEAEIRAETREEAEARIAAQSRRRGQPSAYARTWHRRHGDEETP